MSFMKKKIKKNESLTIIGLVLLSFLFIGINSDWSPPRPAILVYLKTNTTQIIGFTYDKKTPIMMCMACDKFSASGKVVYDNKTICETQNSAISLGDIYLSLLCSEDLKTFEGQTVTVEVNGSVNDVSSKDIKVLKLEFKKKNDLRL